MKIHHKTFSAKVYSQVGGIYSKRFRFAKNVFLNKKNSSSGWLMTINAFCCKLFSCLNNFVQQKGKKIVDNLPRDLICFPFSSCLILAAGFKFQRKHSIESCWNCILFRNIIKSIKLGVVAFLLPCYFTLSFAQSLLGFRESI